MTNPNIPSEEQLDNMEPERNRAVTRESDEGVVLQVNTIAGESVRETTARTYTRGFGHYFVDPNSEATEVLDEFFVDFGNENSVLNTFQRTIGQAYEVTVELDDALRETDYVFKQSNEAEVQIPSHGNYLEDIDEFFEIVDDEVSE